MAIPVDRALPRQEHTVPLANKIKVAALAALVSLAASFVLPAKGAAIIFAGAALFTGMYCFRPREGWHKALDSFVRAFGTGSTRSEPIYLGRHYDFTVHRPQTPPKHYESRKSSHAVGMQSVFQTGPRAPVGRGHIAVPFHDDQPPPQVPHRPADVVQGQPVAQAGSRPQVGGGHTAVPIHENRWQPPTQVPFAPVYNPTLGPSSFVGTQPVFQPGFRAPVGSRW